MVSTKPKHKKTQFFLNKNLFKDLSRISELESRISNLPETERGDAFEVFAEAYFSTQSLHQAQEVWPEKVLSENLRKKLGISMDAGVDGVLKTYTEEYKAYQVKFRSKREALTWGRDKLAEFFGQTDRVDERILFTNSNDLSDITNTRADFYSIKGNDLDRLEQADFQVIENWLKSGFVLREKLSPKPHQTEAINNILKEFEINDRATAIMACGTGKTLVALWVAEKKYAQTILVLLPSLALVRQTLHDWARESSWDKFNYLCVCSDATVIKTKDENDETTLHKQDLDFPVTTQKKVIEKFLKDQSFTLKIIFSTYQSCRIVAQAMPKNFYFDLAIFDEAHKTASRKGTSYSFALQNKNIVIKKRLFLTATPRHYNVNKKDKEGNQRLVFSMNDQKIYGKIAYQLSFRAAVEKDVICDYKIIISTVISDMVNRELIKRGEVIVDRDIIKAQRIANILAIQNAVDKYGMKRIFSFHNSVKSAKSFTANSNEGIGAYLKDFTALHVNGEMSTSKRETLLEEFRESNKAIVSNARCLTEGVNIPAVDMVVFVSPKKSKVDIVQAAGRAMRKLGNKDIGYVLIPVFVQVAENESLEQALEKTQFSDIWDVLQAMKEQDECLVDIISQIMEERGRTLGCNDNRLREKIEILGPEIFINELRKSITTMIIDKLGLSWDEKFGELKAFKEKNGHCNVPIDYPDNLSLGVWVSTQRTRKKEKRISRIQFEKLDSIGFSWEQLKDDFMNQYNYLIKFRKENLDRWPKQEEEFPKGNPLGKWCSWKRANKKKLEQWKIELLEKINFPWNKHDYYFETQYKYLIEYIRENPNQWPKNNEEFPMGNKLGIWCDSLRQRYKPDEFDNRKIKESQIKKLDEINFSWSLEEFYWMQQYEYLILFRKKNPDRWPRDKEEFPSENKLGVWCGTQKDRFKRETLEKWQINKLIKIGFPFKRDLKQKQDQQWIKQYNHLLKFREINPSRWPTNNEVFPENNKLGSWCKKQRRDKNKNLADWKVQKLNGISFPWKVDVELITRDNWIKQHNYLIKFRGIYPNRWPKRGEKFPKNNKLGQWYYHQKERKNQLCEWRIKKLDEIEFPWN